MIPRFIFYHLVDTLSTFPDYRVQRTHLPLFLLANFALMSLISYAGSLIGISQAGIWYVLGISLAFMTVDILSSMLAGFLLLGLAQLISLEPISALMILLLCCLIIPTISYLLRDRTSVGQYENAYHLFYAAVWKILPFGAWELLTLNLLQFNWRPAFRQRLIDTEQQVQFRQTRSRWFNWARTSQSRPVTIYQPRTPQDLQTIVRVAREENRRVRMVGSSYSWAQWGQTNDILVFSGRMHKVEVDLSNPQQPRVTVEAGATNRQLNTVLEQHNLALPSNVVLEVVRIGGIVSTGSHGSGWNNPIVADYVHAIDLVTAQGEIRHFEEGVDAPEVMDAVRLNLGTFGLIWRVTLNVQPSWYVHHQDYRCSIAEMQTHIREWVTTYDAVDLFYFPYCDRVWMKFQKRVENPDPRTIKRPRHSLSNLLVTGLHMEFWRPAHFLMRRLPQLTPTLSRIFFNFAPQEDAIMPIVDWVHHRRNVDSIRLYNIEIAFKLDDEFKTFHQAWDDFVAITDAYQKQGKYPFNIAFNVRFIASSRALLSPAHGEGHTCYIEILSSKDTPYWHEYSSDLAKAWLQLPQAAPHWPKQWEYFPDIDRHLHKRYGENMRQFLDIREELGVDPHDMFVNELCQRIMKLAQPSA